MKTLIDAFILGVIQGIAEWLPISSSGHLVLAQEFFSLDGGIAFDVFLHLSALIVILVFFRRDIFAVGKAFFTLDTNNYEFKLAIFVIVACIATAIVGLVLKNYENLLNNLAVVGFSFLVTSILLFLSRRKTNNKLNFKKAIFIGFLQGLALFPGISRSGSTIAGAKIVGVNEKDAFRFSFLIAVPTIIGAMIIESRQIQNIEFNFLFTGFLTSLIISIPAILLLKKAVMKNKLHYFAYYCISLSILTFCVNFLIK
jgi:undecaprenyl-diphosphatase